MRLLLPRAPARVQSRLPRVRGAARLRRCGGPGGRPVSSLTHAGDSAGGLTRRKSGFGEGKRNGEDVTGVPYVENYDHDGDCTWNINNYVRTDTVRIVP